jgi:cob(I)alamin adenosyltransferase
MKIYTRTGDDGTTGLFGGGRVSKADFRVEAYGSLDEANAVIGWSRTCGAPGEIDRVLQTIQEDLFKAGAELACASGAEGKLTMALIDGEDVSRLEKEIDAAEQGMPKLRVFILPGGAPAAAALHVARCVVRRAERVLVRAADATPVRHELLVYVNRLSDLLFTLARRLNHIAGVPDVPWHALGAPHRSTDRSRT